MTAVVWAIIVILFAFWLTGLTLHLAGAFIHILLVIAVALFVTNLLTGRKARV